MLVDDEAGIRARVRAQLQDQGIHVTVADTVAGAEAAIALRSFGVVIVALALPDGSGLDVIDGLRASGSTAHIIVLSGATVEADRVRALERGADDLVVKPFYLRELTARVLAVRRRRDPAADAVLRIGRFDIDLVAREVTSAGERVKLTAKEFDLLAYLAVRPGHVFDREQLLNAVWRSASEWQQAATVTEHIRRLRQKLEVDPARPTLLATVRGAGYRLDLPNAAVEGEAGVEEAAPLLEPGEIVHVDGLIVFCDQAAADLVGAAAPGAVVGRRLVDLVTTASSAAARERLLVTATGTPRRSQLMDFRHGDAGEVTAAVDSAPVSWHARPARRVRLTPVSDASARLRRLVIGVLGDLTDAVIITDLHFHIRSWNAAAERLYGWSEVDVRGRHVLDVLRWVDEHDQIPDMWEHLEHTGRWHGESMQLARDGSTVEILSSTTLVRDGVGEPVGIVSVNRSAVAARRDRSLEQDASFTARLGQALADDEFDVHYQPVVDLVDGRLIAFEALVRWEHPERGTLPPAEFLDTAERSGLIVGLGERVLEKACRQAAEWRRAGADIYLSVNVSTRQLADPGVVERFTEIMGDAGFDPACLWLEVTETAVVEELEKACLVLRRLVDLGVGVSIDDFGTGWASLTYLRSFPVHTLKIDRSFVARAGDTANDAAIVRSIISLGAELGLFVVAEGIETKAQHEELRRLGCSFGQGYLFGRPAPARDVLIEGAGRIPTAPASGVAGASGATDDGHRPSARRAGAPSPHRRPGPPPLARGPERPTAAVEVAESDVVADLLRGLLRVRSAPAAAELLQTTIRGMGGLPVLATDAGEHALPVDVSLGEGPSVLVEVDRFTVARMQLERLLPRLVEDARQAVDLLRRAERLGEGAAREELIDLARPSRLRRGVDESATRS
nr:EAL domain-containing protein [Rhabdothermincola salaria]